MSYKMKVEKRYLNTHFGKKVIISGENKLLNSSFVKCIMEGRSLYRKLYVLLLILGSFTVIAIEDVM